MNKGLFITFEGIDGSGKSTQAKLLAKELRKRGYQIKLIDFPQHGKASSQLIDKYLRGGYGKPINVGPYQASIFFACDRYNASFKIKQWLKEGRIVIADRYIGSNIGYQGGRIKNKKERKKFIRWLFDLEYNLFQIPKPNITFLLDVPFNICQELMAQIRDKQKIKRKISYLGRLRKDILERNLSYQKMARNAYLETVYDFPKMFKLINCFQNKRLLSPLEIHRIVLDKTKFLKNDDSGY